MAPETAGISLAPARQSPQSPGEPRRDLRIPPKAELLDIVRQTWADVLLVEDVGPDDDFFDLGGTSLLAVSVVALVEERVGVEVPIAALLAAPNPSAMAEQVAAQRANGVSGPSAGTTPFLPEWVIPLQSQGGESPVFLFPGGRGDRLVLAKDAQIVAMTGRRHPFYGFHREQPHIPPGRADWIVAMTADYVAQIRAIQHQGPYLLYGICSGGAMAWETAIQLIGLGETVAGLFFYEVPLPADVEAGDPLSTRTTPARPFSENMPPYAPRPLTVDLTLLMSECWRAKEKSDGWYRVARGPMQTVVMPGNTLTPAVHNLYVGREAMIAGHLRDWLDRMETRCAAM